MTAPLPPADVAARRKRGTELMRSGDPADRRFRVLSSFNADLMPAFLVEAFDRAGISASAETGDYGQIAQELLNPASATYSAPLEGVVVIPAVQDLLAPLFEGSKDHDPEQLADERARELEGAVSAFLDRSPESTCYVVAFGSDHAPVEHVLAPHDAQRGQRAVERFMARVRDLGTLSPRIVVVDWDWHTRSAGSAAFSDDRLWYLGRMRLNPGGCSALADLLVGHVTANTTGARKVLAVDLDDTLWGGIVGEAGVSGIVLGNEGVGLAFKDFQRELLKLRDAGVVLVAASKNNPDDAAAAFSHPEMVLERDHFAAERIGWQDKATGLREMADELRLGLDSFVFLDDNPIEREWVRRGAPGVAVPELPEDPVSRPAFVRGLPFFRRISLTSADLQRAESYAAEGNRSSLRSQTASFDDFLASLEQTVSIEPVGESSAARAAQLCQRTNQFNTTTRRHTIADIEQMMGDPDVELYTLALRDRFGDSGVTGLAIVRFDGDVAELDTLLLSCRVLGRRVEDALLAFVATRVRDRGATRLSARYVPTAKNQQVATLFPDRGFEEVSDGHFQIHVNDDSLQPPDHVHMEVPSNA